MVGPNKMEQSVRCVVEESQNKMEQLLKWVVEESQKDALKELATQTDVLDNDIVVGR